MSDAEESAKVRKLALAMLDLTKEHDCNLRRVIVSAPSDLCPRCEYPCDSMDHAISCGWITEEMTMTREQILKRWPDAKLP